MKMKHVKYFLALCRHKNFTLAAIDCGVSQPSLSNAIRRFEEELGGELFIRGLDETTLSEFGMALRPHLERLAGCADETLRAAATLKSLLPKFTPIDGGTDAKTHAFHRRRRSRRTRRDDLRQNADIRDSTVDVVANLG